MDTFHEILDVVATFATVAGFILEAVREYKHQRMTKAEKERTGGNRS